MEGSSFKMRIRASLVLEFKSHFKTTCEHLQYSTHSGTSAGFPAGSRKHFFERSTPSAMLHDHQSDKSRPEHPKIDQPTWPMVISIIQIQVSTALTMPRTWRSVLHNQEHGRLLKPSHQAVTPGFETSACQNDVLVNTGYWILQSQMLSRERDLSAISQAHLQLSSSLFAGWRLVDKNAFL